MSIDLQRVRGLCFDIDGTLSDTDDMFVYRLIRWLKPLQPLVPHRDLHSFARKMVMATESPGNSVLSLLDRLGVDKHISDIGDTIYRMGLGGSRDPFAIIHGVRDMLEKLQDHYPLSIVSARGQRNSLRFLEQFDLVPFFTCVATAHTCKHTKPYPHPVLWAAQQMGVPAEACLMVGDTVPDIKAGKAAGAQTVGVLCGFGYEDELRQAGADEVLPHTAMLLDVVLNSRF